MSREFNNLYINKQKKLLESIKPFITRSSTPDAGGVGTISSCFVQDSCEVSIGSEIAS